MTFEDRQYQLDAADYAMEAEGRPILCSPTGSGKSYICAMIAQRTLDAGGTFGILTPREEILYQMADTMREVIGHREVGVLKAGETWNQHAPVQVISWPTLLSRTARSGAWFPNVTRMAVDECHLAVSPKMAERVLPYYRDRCKVFGVTATPSRKSGKGLGSFFTNIKHVTTVRQLIEDGKLSPLDYFGGALPDVSKVRTTGGDYNSKDLSKVTQVLVGDVIDNWIKLARDRHTIVFAVDVAHAEALTERFQQAGVAAAALHIHKTPERRKEIVAGFKAGNVQVLVNVTIASYGFDAPSVDCIVLARPTKSIVLHLQMLGRGMRVHEGKTECLVLDHADNVRRLGYADDPFRWRLSEGKEASANWARDPRNPDRDSDEAAKVYTCEKCQFMFSRSLECPKCGTEIPMPKREPEHVDADLVRIGKEFAKPLPDGWPDHETFYRMLMGYADYKGYKPGWAYVTYKDKTESNPPYGWNTLEPLHPSVAVRNWISGRLRAYARAKKREQNAA